MFWMFHLFWLLFGDVTARGGVRGRHHYTHLKLIVSIVVKVKMAEQLWICTDDEIVCMQTALRQSLAGILLHLDVEKLPGNK